MFVKKKFADIILIIMILFAVVTGYASEYAKVTGDKIAKSVIRLHIVANSDSEFDQKLKLKVRDEVTEYLSPLLSKAKNAKETEEIILKNLSLINKTAKDVIEKNGFNYSVKSQLKEVNFPTKHYGDIALPAGKYEALQITIGKGEGKNWWCVVYPQLCLNNRQKDEPSDNAFAKLSEESKKKLKDVLSPEEYELISNTNKKDIKIKFKILEWINKV